MTVNLYHGTSAIFLESIRKHGLGTINPNFDFKNLEVLKFLREEAERVLIDNERYLNWRECILAMVRQTDLIVRNDRGEKLSFNYKHDGTFASYSAERAAIYTCSNKYGSEILEYCVEIYKMIKTVNQYFTLPNEINLFGIEKYVDIEHKPIIVEIQNVRGNEIETENGQPGEEALKALKRALPNMTKRQKFEELQFLNFKFLVPVKPARLKFYEVEFHSEPKYRDYEWTMSEIIPR